jgi:mono/diheme cytochrome c family protein
MPALNPEPPSHGPAAAAESEVQLALSAAAGNAMALETIVRRHNRLLFRTARGVVADDAEAQDVDAVVQTYNTRRALGLNAQEIADLAQYLKSL